MQLVGSSIGRKPSWLKRGLSEVAVKNLERGRTDPGASTLIAIQEAFDHARVVFLDPGDPATAGPACGLSSKA